MVIQEAGDPHAVPQAEPVDGPLELVSQRAVAHDDQLEVRAAVPQPRRRLDQQELALLLGQPPHGHQPRPIRDGHAGRARKTPSRPQRTTWILGQSSVAHHRQSWLRVKWLMATTKSA